MTASHLQAKKDLNQFYAEAMAKTYSINDLEINLNKLGWTRGYNNNKSRLGVCKPQRKLIEISTYFINHSEETIKEMRDTILHEIAHAIDVELRGYSDHSYKWQNIAVQVGANPTRTASVDMSGAKSKYTGVCTTCKKETPIHRKPRVRKACGKCCKIYNYGRFTTEYLLNIRQNY